VHQFILVRYIGGLFGIDLHFTHHYGYPFHGIELWRISSIIGRERWGELRMESEL
jgi:hypothetical protein